MKISGEGMLFIVTAAQSSNHVGVGHRKVYNYRLNNTGSATTHYDLKMGLYAQKSIFAIRDELILRTPVLLNAVNWHIWKNYGYVLFLIIATNSKKENLRLFKDCRKYMLIHLLSTLLKSKVNIKAKCNMILQAFVPVMLAKKSIHMAKIALQNDVME
mgnify:CR=1 FL=1